MATPNSKVNSSAQLSSFWERLYGALVGDDGEEGGENQPKRRGLAITISVLVSALLWFTFSMRETYSALLQLPIQIVNLPETQSLRVLPPPSVRVQVQGEGLTLIRLSLNKPVVPVNGQRNEVDLRESVAEVLQNVQLLSVSPPTLGLEKERRVTRKIPIRLRADVDTPPTHDLIAPPAILPDSVEVSGAASVVGELQYWPTERIEITGLRDSVQVEVSLADTLRGLVARNTDATTLRAVAGQFTEGSREIEVLVTEQPSNQRLVTLEPSVIQVRYKVLFEQYRQAEEAQDFFATVSYDEIRRDTTGRVRPRITLPKGLILRDVEPIPPTLRYYQRLE